MPKLQITPRVRPDISGLVKECMFTEPQMSQLGDYADDLMDRRVDSDTPRNIFGEPRPPLSERYKRRKLREGRRGVRDMRRTGKTLAAKNVIDTKTDSEGVKTIVGIKGSKEYQKGLFSQNIDPWFGLIDPDPDIVGEEEQKVFDRADDILDFNIKRVNGR